MTEVSRRSFLKTTGAGLAACAIPMAAAHAKDLTPDTKWDLETDVLVLGGGGAGTAAAIEAFDKGANVLLIEKMPELGGNTAVSSGGFMIPDDPDQAYKYLKSTYTYLDAEYDEDLLQAFIKGTLELKDFFKKQDPEAEFFVYGYAGFKPLEGSETIKRWRVKGKKGAPRKGSGDCVFDVMKMGVAKRQIPVMLNTSAVRLIRNGDEIVGAVINKDGKELNVCAKKGVVLATGGFENDPETLGNYAVGNKFMTKGNPGNTGDGLRMAQSVGARIWHMNSYSSGMGVKVPGKLTGIESTPKGSAYIWVDQEGKRFVNEKIDGHTQIYSVMWLDATHHRYDRIPCYQIFDHTVLEKGPLGSALGSGYIVNREGVKWSKDLEPEVAQGYVKKAQTLEELANMIGVPPQNLVETVKRWNENVAAGNDKDFYRPMKKEGKGAYIYDGPTMSEPIQKAPFYAVALYPNLTNTQGGPKRNAKAQIVDVYGIPIKRLYGAGELGSMWTALYQGACNVSEAFVFGRIAGQNAADEKPWR